MTKALSDLRAVMSQWGVDAVLIPHEDQYLNEHLPPWSEILAWVSGFTGSAGQAVVTAQDAALFVDSRYTIQAKQQIDAKSWQSFLIEDARPEAWLDGKAKRVGYDPSCLSKTQEDTLKERLGDKNIEAVALPSGAVHGLMHNLTNAAPVPIETFPEAFEGRGVDEKLAAIRAEMQSHGMNAALIADPTLVSWLLGWRARVVPMTPQILGRALITMNDVRITLDPIHASMLPDLPGVRVVDELGAYDGVVGYDPDTTPPALLKDQKTIKPVKALFQKLRAAKTPASRAVIKAALRRDNKILDTFFKELIVYLQTNTAYEHEIGEMIAQARAKHPLYVEESFDPIVGFRENGAIIHYRPTPGASKLVKGEGVLLVDCGGQYLDATTDRTTTILLGDVGVKAKSAYEAVVKAHKALAHTRFTAKTTGAQLAGIAHKPLWDAGYDCPHGIGHGVGQFLGVHEGPFSISPRGHQSLPEGLLISNEPGIYVEGEFGIRHERLYFVEKDERDGMLYFSA